MKNITLGYSLILLLVSIVFSIFTATSINLKADDLGSLFNIYCPVLLGFLTVLLLCFAFLLSKRLTTRIIALTSLVTLNVAVAVILRLAFNAFFYVVAQPAVALGADSTVINEDRFPGNNFLAFSLLNEDLSKHKINALTNLNHDSVTVTLRNNRSYQITILKAVISANKLWKIGAVNGGPPVFPVTVPAKDSVRLTVVFTAEAIKSRITGKLWKPLLALQYQTLRFLKRWNYQIPVGSTCAAVTGKLHFLTDDKTASIAPIILKGLWQYRAESDWEPELPGILSTLGLSTNVGFVNFDNGINGEKIIPGTDEISAGLFKPATPGGVVKIIKLASYHGCCQPGDGDTLLYYHQNSGVTNNLIASGIQTSQMLLPPTSASISQFSPKGIFGLRSGNSDTDRTKNYHHKIGIRIWKARDNAGKLILNTYVMGCDYLGTRGTNYDYQDNVYYIQNVIPVKR